METNDENMAYLEFELITLKKFIQEHDEDLHDTRKKLIAEELFAFFNDRLRYRVSFHTESPSEMK